MADDEKPTTNGFVTTSQGRRVKVDELDMAVLNVGYGSNPMTNQHLDSGRGNFRRPIYNVEPNPQLQQSPRMHSTGPMSHEVFGDGNNPQTIRQSTGLQHFDQIHSVNPYAYDPVTTANSLLAPQGQLVVTGTARNPFAHPIDTATTERANIGTRQQPNHVQVNRMSHTTTDLSPPQSTQQGQLNPVHSKFPQLLSDGRAMPTTSSQSHTYHQIPQGFHDVTPRQTQVTQQNTQANTGRRMSVAEANHHWQNMERQSPRSQATSSSKPKKSVQFKQPE